MERPLVWVATAFAVGIALSSLGLSPLLVLLVSGAGAGCLAAWCLPERRWSGIVCVCLLFIAAGFAWATARAPRAGPDDLCHVAHTGEKIDCVVRGRVRRPDVTFEETEYTRFVLAVDRAWINGVETPASGNVYVRLNAPSSPLFDDEQVLARGRLLLPIGHQNPGLNGIEDYMRRHGVYCSLRVKSGDHIEKLEAGRWWYLPYWTSRLRAVEAARLARSVPHRALPFLLTVLLGARNTLPVPNYDDYVRTRTAHILAVSGIHTAIVFIVVQFLGGVFIRRRRLRAVVGIAAVLLFALLAGARISVMRASVMVTLYLLGGVFDRDPDAPTALSASALLFTLLNPLVIFDIGFQLSFLSVASILLYSDPLQETLRSRPNPLKPEPDRRLWHLKRLLVPSLAVQILPFPLVAHYFHIIPILAPLLNLFVIPLLGAVLLLGFTTLAVAMISVPMAKLFGAAAAVFVLIIETTVHVTAWGPFSPRVTSPTTVALMLFWAAAAALLGLLRWKEYRRPLTGVAIALIVGTALCWNPWRSRPRVVFLDIGHGDASYIHTPDGADILVDTGREDAYSPATSRIVLPFLWSNHVRSLDYLVITHADSDHIGGAETVLKQMKVGEVWLPAFNSDKPAEKALLRVCAERGVPVRRMKTGDRFETSFSRLAVLHPPADIPESTSPNNASLVLRMDWPSRSFLFAGDIEAEAEAVIAANLAPVEVLKAPHHGSATSSTRGFLEAASPRHAVISTGGWTGRESLSRPVLDRYGRLEISAWRTDLHGAVSFEWDAGTREPRCERVWRRHPAFAVRP